MPLVQAYLCPRTATFHLEKDAYIQHLKVLARKSLDQKNSAKLKAQLLSKFTELRKTARGLSDVSSWLQGNMETILAMNKFTNGFGDRVRGKPVLSSFDFSRVKYSETCSNTHAKPFHGETNWGWNPDKHRGYPGITGDVNYTLSGDFEFNRILEHALGLRMGSGGGGGNNQYHYDFTMFAEDWPFIGVKILYDARRKTLSDDHKRILQYAFPRCDIDAFVAMRSTGLLPEAQEAFTDYMFQFVDACGTRILPDVILPENVSFDATTEPHA